MVMPIAPSPGPLSKRFGQMIDSILRRDDIENLDENKDTDIVVTEETNEDVGKVIVVDVQEEDDVEDDVEDAVEDATSEEDDEVVIIQETPGNIVVKEEPIEEDDDEEDDIKIEERTLFDDIEIEESTDSVEVHVEERSENVSEADTFANEEVAEPVTKKAEETEEAEDDIVYYKDAQVEYEFGDMRKENGVYFVPLKKPVLIQTPVVKLLEPISGDSTSILVSGGFTKFVKNHEENMLKFTKENKTKWFKNGIEDSALDGGFKSFLESDTLKVKISRDFAAFDMDGDFIENTFCTPAEVRCILKISGVWFGSAEFGSIMSLVQTQLAKLPKCSIKPTRERKKYNYARDFV